MARVFVAAVGALLSTPEGGMLDSGWVDWYFTPFLVQETARCKKMRSERGDVFWTRGGTKNPLGGWAGIASLRRGGGAATSKALAAV
jgi:hypothetical protein